MNGRFKRICMPSVFIVAGLMVLCGPRLAPASQTKSPPAVPAKKAFSQSDWANLVAEAKKEGKVVIYASPLGNTSGELTKAFKNKFGISLEFQMGRGQALFEKLLRERRAGLYLADLGIGGASPFFKILEPANVVVPLEPLLILGEVKDPSKWRSGQISFLDRNKALIALVSLTSLYATINTTMVKPSEISSFSDFLDPKWKGKIVINDPTVMGRGNSWFLFLMELYGKEKGAAYMKKLVGQEAVIVRNERQAVEWVAKGKYPVGLGLKPTEVTSFLKAGAPLKDLALKEAAPLSSGSLNMYVFEKPAHPNATKLFLNWVLTKEAGEIIQKASGYASERADIPKDGFDPSLVPGPNDVIKDSSKDDTEFHNIAKQIFKAVVQ